MISSDNQINDPSISVKDLCITMNEITIDELRNLDNDTYELIDIRDEELVLYGMIPNAIHISLKQLKENSNDKNN